MFAPRWLCAVLRVGRIVRGGPTRGLARVGWVMLVFLLGLTHLRGGAVAIAQDPQEQGLWEGPYAMPVVAIHAALLPTGEVLVYSSGASARLLNWVDWAFRPVPTDQNIFCSGHSFLADGTLLVTGGALPGNRGLPRRAP